MEIAFEARNSLGGARGPPVGALRQFLVVDDHEHRLARLHQHRDEESRPRAGQRVTVLVVDHVATRLPERFACFDHPFRLALQFEADCSLQDVPKHGPE